MSRWSLDKTAEEFDELYTRMTGLQRRLIEATRSGDESDPRTRELLDEARAVIAACDAAGRVMRVGYDAGEVEARALRSRVLNPPLDSVLIMAAARSLPRPYAYPLLADALAFNDASDGDTGGDTDLWAERTVLDLLRAPQRMGEFTARRVAEHVGVAADAFVTELDDIARAQLVAGLRECAERLPESVARGGRRPKLPEDASGAGRDLLDRWVDESGTGTDPVRVAARQASLREGWPVDGVPVAERLVAFTGEVLMPRMVPDFEVLAGESGFEQRITAMRAEERSYLHRWRSLPEGEEQDEAFRVYFALGKYIEALRGAAKARQLVELPPEQWRSGSPLTNARTAARRCGEILSLFTEQAVELLGQLPGDPEPGT